MPHLLLSLNRSFYHNTSDFHIFLYTQKRGFRRNIEKKRQHLRKYRRNISKKCQTLFLKRQVFFLKRQTQSSFRQIHIGLSLP